MTETEVKDQREPGQICPNPECSVDQRFKGHRGFVCPECAVKLVVACSMCNSGAVEEVGGSPRCSDHVDTVVPRTIYLASSFSLTDRVQRVYEALEAEEYKVPDVWWNEDLKQIDLPDDKWYQHPDVEAIAERHWNSIDNSDTFVLVCPEHESKKYNGANAEFGYAHARGLDCYSIGELERSAMYEPITRVDSIEELLSEFRGGVHE
jgi:nucleoside 2-deoxyribosyltransferase